MSMQTGKNSARREAQQIAKAMHKWANREVGLGVEHGSRPMRFA